MSKLTGSFNIQKVRRYLGNFAGLAGLANSAFYKTEPIFKGLGHGEGPNF